MRKIAKRRSIRLVVVSAAGVVGTAAIAMLAIPATAAVPTVTFKGGCTGVAASSIPDQDTLTTQKAGASDKTAEVVLVNRLNTSATPYADGKPVKWTNGKTVVVAKGDSVTVPLKSGPVKLTLIPDCSLLGVDTTLREDFQAVTVSVRSALPGATSAGSQTSAAADGTGSGPGSTDPTPRSRKAPAAGADPVAKGAVPPGAQTGKDLAGAEAVAPLGSDSEGNAPQVAPMVPRNHTRTPANGVLAVIAGICLLGVGVAAVRTLAVNRSARVGDI